VQSHVLYHVRLYFYAFGIVFGVIPSIAAQIVLALPTQYENAIAKEL
jgi:hypothetical protein